MNFLETKIPPPLVALCTGTLMWFGADQTPPVALPPAWRLAIALTLIGIGLCCDLAGLILFLRRRTTINPLKPQASSALVCTGIYRRTRNPMYLGLLFILLGWAAYLSNLLSLLLVPLFVGYITRFQIVPEERILADKFGAAFAAYRAQVRRWL
jgi:protein-S-isoprenylcysteine O-methyltransferase Ste14